MPHPAKIEGLSAEMGIGKGLKVHLKTHHSSHISNRQSNEIFEHVNQNVGKHHKHSPQNTNSDVHQNQPNTKVENEEISLPKTTQAQQNNLTEGHERQNTTPQNQTNAANNNQGNIENPTQAPKNPPTSQPTLGETITFSPNLNGNGNHNGAVRNVVRQVLEQNNLFLNNNKINKLVNKQNSQVLNQPNVLVQNIEQRVLSLLDNPQNLNDKTISQVAREISIQFSEQIQTAKNAFLQNADLSAKTFQNLNIEERMMVAIEQMPPHLPADAGENLLNHTFREILDGFLLARGLIAGGEVSADIRNLISFKPTILPNEISLTAFRDVGQLVKILIGNAANAKNINGLELAVQKFVRILIANNELGVLLAAVNLAGQAKSRGGLMTRTLALVQIYELISRLVLAGEKALKQAMTEASPKNIWQNTDKNVLVTDKKLVPEEKNTQNTKIHGTVGESNLRQFLEFNPNSAFDNSASAFYNPDDARHAQQHFASIHHQDIDQWLQSGNHRFVKDYDFEKPIGIVVERNNDDFFTASKARIVLVRDSSVQGWHVLKSLLVK